MAVLDVTSISVRPLPDLTSDDAPSAGGDDLAPVAGGKAVKAVSDEMSAPSLDDGSISGTWSPGAEPSAAKVPAKSPIELGLENSRSDAELVEIEANLRSRHKQTLHLEFEAIEEPAEAARSEGPRKEFEAYAAKHADEPVREIAGAERAAEERLGWEAREADRAADEASERSSHLDDAADDVRDRVVAEPEKILVRAREQLDGHEPRADLPSAIATLLRADALENWINRELFPVERSPFVGPRDGSDDTLQHRGRAASDLSLEKILERAQQSDATTRP